MSYWSNVKGLLSLLALYTEQASRSVGNLSDVATLGEQADELDRAKMKAALRDLRSAVRSAERLLSTLDSLTEAASRVSSDNPSR